METSFDNLMIGPVVSIPNLNMKQELLQDILDRGLIVTSYITDDTHPAFKIFSDAKPKDKAVAIFITIQYQYYYE